MLDPILNLSTLRIVEAVDSSDEVPQLCDEYARTLHLFQFEQVPYLFLVEDSKAIFLSSFMFYAASSGLLPPFAEIGSMAKRHVFKGFGEEAERNLSYSSLLHVLLRIPLISE